MSAPRCFRVGQLEIRFHLAPADSRGVVALFESVIPAGARVPVPHRHLGYDETIHVLAGTCTFKVEHQGEVAVAAGGTLFVPRGIAHGFANLGHDTVRLLVAVTPGLLGPDYFEAVAALVNAGGPPDVARIGALMAQHGMQPVPQL
jgi:quercetin dioxygenase-like cupin family protein